jgi:hypothetical protein
MQSELLKLCKSTLGSYYDCRLATLADKHLNVGELLYARLAPHEVVKMVRVNSLLEF